MRTPLPPGEASDIPDSIGAAAFVFQDTANRYVNPAAEVITGYSREELLAMPFWAIIHPEDRELVREHGLARQRGEPRPWHYEVRIQRKDGAVRWLAFNAGMFEYEGRPAVLGTAIDVTDRKRITEQLRQSEHRFRALTENSSDIVVVTNADGTFQYVGPSLERVLGFPPEGMVGSDGLALVHHAEVEQVRSTYAQLVRTPGARATAVYRVRHRDGSWRWLESIGRNLLDEPSVQGIIVNSRDVTERVEVERAYQTLIDHSLQGLAIIQDGRIAFCNRRLAEIMGRTVDEVLQLGPDEQHSAIHEDDAPAVSRKWPRLAGVPQEPRTELRVVRKDGATRCLETYATATEYRGRPALQVAYLDVTEWRDAEEAARRHQYELAHVLRRRSMDEMAAVFAHEINQPLTAITNFARGCSNHLRKGTGTPQQLLAALDEIAAQALSAAAIIRRLHSFVRRSEPDWRETRLQQLVDEVVHFVTSEARQHRIRIRVEADADLPALPLDAVQIEQALFNLVRNAIDAMSGHPGGRRQLVIRAARSNGAIEVAVRDNGPGLDSNVAARIFDPFVTSKPNGLGMGLSICRSIVEAHGGSLRATPNPEGGMTFAFTLPLPEHE